MMGQQRSGIEQANAIPAAAHQQVGVAGENPGIVEILLGDGETALAELEEIEARMSVLQRRQLAEE